MRRCILILAALLPAVSALAQKGNIGFVYPSGAERGTTFTLTVGGQNLQKATAVLIGGEGITSELLPNPNANARKKKRRRKDIGEEDNLQLADQVRFRVTIAPDAPLGMRDVRLVLPNGMTNRLYFEVGEIPDVLEDAKAEISARAAALPVCFNGQVMRSDVDRFVFPAKKGQQLVLKVKAREFVPYMADAVPGWFQPVIRLYDPDGKEVAFNDDYTFHVDPVLFYKVPRSGDYAVEINDALWRGREDFVYRIEVGELPFITGITPIGCRRSAKKTAIQLRGYNLKSYSLSVKPNREGRIPITMQSKAGLTSNTALFLVSDKAQARPGKKPNLSRDTAWPLEIDREIENNFSSPLQQHWYAIEVVDNKPILLSVIARRLDAPTDARVTVFDKWGKQVADQDDFEDADECMMTHFADPQLSVKLSPGSYLVRVMESQGCFGKDYSYRLSYQLSVPDFSLHLVPATFSVPASGTGVFTVNLTRKQKFQGEVELDVKGLPKGFKVGGAVIRKGTKKAFVSVTAPQTAMEGVYNPKVTGTGVLPRQGLTIVHDAVPAEEMMQAFYYTHLMPIGEFRMEVGPALPFTMEVEKGDMSLNRSKRMKVKVKINRNEGFNQPVTIMSKSTLSGVKADAIIIPADSSEGELEYYVTRKKPVKRAQQGYISLTGVVKSSSRRIAGKGRNAFVSSITAHAPSFEYELLP